MEAGALRLVLFGLPAAGKSALLGALVQTKAVADPAPALAELQKNWVENRLQPTRAEVTSYTVALEPQGGQDRRPVEVVDSSGQSAAEMLDRRRPVEGRKSGPLGKALRRADALVVAADAAAPTQLQRDLGRLAAFVRLVELSRARRTEVAGLPVFLVLTKCDLLAGKNDTAPAWRQRLEESKHLVDQAIKNYLAKQADRDGLAFGKV